MLLLKKYSLVVLLGLSCGLLFSGCYAKAPENLWHTSPDQWDQSRLYHSLFQNQFASHMKIYKGDWPTEVSKEYESSNKAYTYFIHHPDFMKDGPWVSQVFIDNERGDPLVFEVVNHNQWGIQAKWINEKLLYVSMWWGRILGSYVIIDVEKESIIVQEMIHDGAIAYQQFKQQ